MHYVWNIGVLLGFSMMYTPLAAAKKKSTSTVATSTCSPGVIPTYTYTLVNNAKGRPTILPTKSAYVIPVQNQTTNETVFHAYMSNQGVPLPQIAVNDTNGNAIIVNKQNTSSITMFHTTLNMSVIIDRSGVRIFNESTAEQLLLPISNLTSVIDCYNGNMQASGRSVLSTSSKREPEDTGLGGSTSQLPFELDFKDQCGNPIKGHTLATTCDIENPNLEYSEIQNMVLQNSGNGVFKGYCTLPYSDFQDELAKCQSMMKGLLDLDFSTLLSDSTNYESNLKTIGRIVHNGLAAQALKPLQWFIKNPWVQAALEGLADFQTIMAFGGDETLSKLACKSWYNFDLAVDAGLDKNSPAQVNLQLSAPFATFTSTRTVSLSTISCSSTSTTTAPTPTSSCPTPFSNWNGTFQLSSGGIQGYCGTDLDKVKQQSNMTGNIDFFQGYWDGYWFYPCTMDSDCPLKTGSNSTRCYLTGDPPCNYGFQCAPYYPSEFYGANCYVYGVSNGN